MIEIFLKYGKFIILRAYKYMTIHQSVLNFFGKLPCILNYNLFAVYGILIDSKSWVVMDELNIWRTEEIVCLNLIPK